VPPFAIAAAAQTVDKPEPGSVEAIANAKTEPRFLSPWFGRTAARSAVMLTMFRSRSPVADLIAGQPTVSRDCY
jgi:hypothetical protein